jgi:hypothetical protein
LSNLITDRNAGLQPRFASWTGLDQH